MSPFVCVSSSLGYRSERLRVKGFVPGAMVTGGWLPLLVAAFEPVPQGAGSTALWECFFSSVSLNS